MLIYVNFHINVYVNVLCGLKDLMKLYKHMCTLNVYTRVHLTFIQVYTSLQTKKKFKISTLSVHVYTFSYESLYKRLYEIV